MTVGRTYAHNEQARVCTAVRRGWGFVEGNGLDTRRGIYETTPTGGGKRVRCPVRLPGPWIRGERNDKPNEQFNKTSPMTRLTQNTKGDDKIKTETETQDATKDTKALTTALRVHVPGAAHGGQPQLRHNTFTEQQQQQQQQQPTGRGVVVHVRRQLPGPVDALRQHLLGLSPRLRLRLEPRHRRRVTSPRRPPVRRPPAAPARAPPAQATDRGPPALGRGVGLAAAAAAAAVRAAAVEAAAVGTPGWAAFSVVP